MSVVIGLITGLLLYASTQLSIRDVDLYWHLRAGAELLRGVPVDSVGAQWSYAPDPLHWVTTQWLAEVVIQQIHAVASWSGLVAYRTLTAALVVCILAATTIRGRPPILAAFPYVIAAASAISVSQERPNQATLVGAAALGAVLVQGLAEARLPRWWLLLPLTWLWANFHGGWVLVPATLALVALGRVLDGGMRDGVARRALGLGLACALVGTMTPAGTASTLAVFRFSNATGVIQEWMRTTPLEGMGLLTLGMVGLLALAWARSSVPRSEVVVTMLLVVFSWNAVRNVAPALLILAPLVARRLSLAFPGVGQGAEPRWSVPVGIALACGLLIAGLATIPGREHLPVADYPVALAQQVAKLPGPQRVLNDYNVAGFVLFFANPEDQVGIDGRADRYNRDYIDAYIGLETLAGEWNRLLTELDPTAALLEGDSALAHVLVAEMHWVTVGQDGDWVLLSAPTRS